MATYLRAIIKVIQSVGSLQPGIPLPSSLPKGWPITVVVLKDYIFTISLQE